MIASTGLLEFREAILDAARRHGASRVRVFGSALRGESRPDSDIDFLVQLDCGRSLIDLIALEQELEQLLGRRVDVIVESGLSPYLSDRIRQEATPL